MNSTTHLRHTFVRLLALGLGISQSVFGAAIDTVLQPSRSPLVTISVLFRTGAVNDPTGQEGVANLTASMIAEGGSRQMTYEKILEALYPMAARVGAQVDKEMTLFMGTTHVDNLDRYYGLLKQMLLEPGFREEDFSRLKSEAINYLKVSLREANDEELGKEVLYARIYAGHPYGHHTVGSISSLEKLTLDHVREFYRQNYTQARLVIGLAGGFPSGTPEKLTTDFAVLPAGSGTNRLITRPAPLPIVQIDLLQRETRATAISLGFPISVKRGHPDWPALAVATSYLGQHRSMNGVLFQKLREKRGLNYGNYAYLEYFPRGMFQFEPDPNLARSQQIFQIWIRPVEPKNAHFALRAALYELDRLVRDGMSKEDFAVTREFLSKNVHVLLQTQAARLGYALDSRHYGIGPFDQYLRDALAQLTVEQVNEAVRKHLKSGRMNVVMVTKDAAGLKEALLANRPSPITYNSPKPEEILAEDKIIETWPITTRNVNIIPVEKVFQ